MKARALSVVAPAGNLIRAGVKTLEVRRWVPDVLPLRDLVIVQNKIRLSTEGVTEDAEGEAVALVDIEAVGEWREDQLAEACGSWWEPGWKAWRLTNVRPIEVPSRVPARLGIYEIDLPEPQGRNC
ncbi:MAG: ASCH domain-containing protein [Luteolibacter sp.]